VCNLPPRGGTWGRSAAAPGAQQQRHPRRAARAQVLKVEPRHKEALVRLARLWLRVGRLAPALEAAERAAAAHGGDFAVHALRGDVLACAPRAAPAARLRPAFARVPGAPPRLTQPRCGRRAGPAGGGVGRAALRRRPVHGLAYAA